MNRNFKTTSHTYYDTSKDDDRRSKDANPIKMIAIDAVK